MNRRVNAKNTKWKTMDEQFKLKSCTHHHWCQTKWKWDAKQKMYGNEDCDQAANAIRYRVMMWKEKAQRREEKKEKKNNSELQVLCWWKAIECKIHAKRGERKIRKMALTTFMHAHRKMIIINQLPFMRMCLHLHSISLCKWLWFFLPMTHRPWVWVVGVFLQHHGVWNPCSQRSLKMNWSLKMVNWHWQMNINSKQQCLRELQLRLASHVVWKKGLFFWQIIQRMKGLCVEC